MFALTASTVTRDMTAIIMRGPSAWQPIWHWIEAPQTFTMRDDAFAWIKLCNAMGRTP